METSQARLPEAALNLITTMRQSGSTAGDIAAALNQGGFKTPRGGKKFTPAAVYGFFNRAKGSVKAPKGTKKVLRTKANRLSNSGNSQIAAAAIGFPQRPDQLVIFQDVLTMAGHLSADARRALASVLNY